MDIPKQTTSTTSQADPVRPLSPVAPSSNATTDSQARYATDQERKAILRNTTTLKELSLPVGQRIIAKIIGELDNTGLRLGQEVRIPSQEGGASASNASNLGKPSALPDRASALNSPALFQQLAPANIQQPGRDWLLQVGQQYLLTSTAQTLEPGKLLILVALSNGQLTLTNPTLTPTATSTPSAISASDLGTSTKEAPTTQSELIAKLIRQALTRTLPQQTSLSSGFQTLAQTAQSTPAEGSLKEQRTQILATLIQEIGKQQFPSSSELSSLVASSAKTAVQNGNPALALVNNLKSWIRTSGIEYESSLLNSAKNNADTNSLDSKARGQQSELSVLLSAVGRSAPLSLGQQAMWLNAATKSIEFSAHSLSDKTSDKHNLAKHTSMARSLAKLLALNGSNATLSAVQQLQLATQRTEQAGLALTQLFKSLDNAPDLLQNSRANQTLERALTMYQSSVREVRQMLPVVSQDLTMLNPNQNNAPLSSRQKEVATIAVQVMERALNMVPLQQKLGGDVKALLQDIAQGLKLSVAANQTAQQNAQSASNPDTRGLLENDLLIKPFVFPKMQTNVLKAQAILADQELSVGQLLKLVAGMINRIQFNQASSLLQSQNPGETGITQSWNMELPYTHGQQIQTLQLRIDQHNPSKREHKQDKERAPSWTIHLSFDLEGIGPMHVSAELVPPRLSTQVWVENEKAKSMFEQERALLVDRLNEAGFEAEKPTCIVGQPSQTASPSIKHGLVDIHT